MVESDTSTVRFERFHGCSSIWSTFLTTTLLIVTAAVHRSFRKRLHPCGLHHPLLTYRHWAGVSPYTLPFGFAGTCVLDKQSLSNLLLNPAVRRGRASPIGYAQLLLPSSLNICLPVALVYSTNPPVSVMRYGKI